MKNFSLLFTLISFVFSFPFWNIQLSNAQTTNNCSLEILNDDTHCNSTDFSLLINYSGDYPEFTLEIYIDNELIDNISTSPWNWNDTQDYFNSLEAGNHFVDIIGYNEGIIVCSAGKTITLLDNCSIPNEPTMWCDIDFSNLSTNNSFCEHNPPLIYTEVSAFTDVIMLFLDYEPVGTQAFSQNIYTSNNESLKVIWSSDIYENLNNLTVGMHTIILHTENSLTGMTCSSEIEFYIEECEDTSNGITIDDGDKYKLNIKLLLSAFYNSETKEMNNLSYQKNLIPLEQPFADSYFRYYGNETLDESNLDIVDWVLVTLRTDEGSIIEKKAGLLLKDGSVLDPLSKTLDFTFNSNSLNNYYVSILHRSHLAVISKNTIPTNSFADFSQSGFTKGNLQTSNQNNLELLIAGDLDSNGIINNLDYNIWAINSAAVNIYGAEDIDGNGIVNNLDFNKWAQNRDKVGTLELLDNNF